MPAMNCYGYFEYTDFRCGVDCGQGDPDGDLPGVPEHELIVDRTGRLDEALLSDEDPNEVAVGDLLLIRLMVPRKVALPEEIDQKSGPPHLDIDREFMPWSAIYLRPQEIRYTLLAALRSRASGETVTEPAEAETCALIAVCLETGRSLEQALGLQYAPDPKGDITLLPAAGPDRSFRWVWQGIQPLYRTQPPHIGGLEVMRSDYLVNAVHWVADSLLRKWMLARKHSTTVLFTAPSAEYRIRIQVWLEDLAPGGRLTLARIGRLKWSLLSQLTGGDYARASLVLGLPHARSRVALFYALVSTQEAGRLFVAATSLLWAEGN